MKASDLMVAALEAEGVEYVFAVPGEENLDLLESLRTSAITLVLARHEQGAGFMAATYGRLTGKAGVCLATLGPGATNLTTPAAYAALGAFPLVIITGQKPIKTSKQAQFQIVDVVSLFTPLCKASTQIVNGNPFPRSFAKVSVWRRKKGRALYCSSCRKISLKRKRSNRSYLRITGVMRSPEMLRSTKRPSASSRLSGHCS